MFGLSLWSTVFFSSSFYKYSTIGVGKSKIFLEAVKQNFKTEIVLWYDHLNTHSPQEKYFLGAKLFLSKVNYLKYKSISVICQNMSLAHANIDPLCFYNNSCRNVEESMLDTEMLHLGPLGSHCLFLC